MIFRLALITSLFFTTLGAQFAAAAEAAAKNTQAAEAPAALVDDGKVGLNELLTSAQRALGQVVRSGKADPVLSADDSKTKPFWDGLRQANDNLSNAETSATLKSEKFTEQLATALAAVEQADIARIMNGGGSKVLANELEQLQKIVLRLNENYGPYASRLRAGGKLTREERRKLDQLKDQQKELEKKLKIVEKKAGKNNKEIQAGIAAIREKSKNIKRSRRNVGGFVGGMFAGHLLSSYLWGWHWWWGPWGVWCPGYIEINIDIWVDGWDSLEYDWALLDMEYDVADLDLDSIDYDMADWESMDMELSEADYSMSDGDISALTEGLDYGWDDISSDMGYEAMSTMESNFDSMPYDSGSDWDAIDSSPADYGGDWGGGDYGGDYGGGGDWGGGGWDW